MKRDMDLIRKILLWAIDEPHGYLAKNPEIEGYTDEQIAYHVYLMDQAGLVEAATRDVIGIPSPDGTIISVRWAGYEFADATRDDTIWRRAMKSVLSEGRSFSFEILKEFLKAAALQGPGPS